MSIGCKMRSLGESTYFMRFLEPKVKELMGETPYKLDYVNGQRKVIIHTDRVDNEKLEAIKNAFIELETNVIIKEEQYNHHIEISWRDINKYAECVTVADLLAANSNVANDVTSDGFWGFPLPKFNDKIYDVLKDTVGITHLELYLPEQISSLKSSSRYKIAGIQTLSIYAPKYKGDWALFWWESELKKTHLYVPSATNISEWVSGSRKLVEVTGDFSAASNALLFANSCNSLKRCEIEFPNLSIGGNMFGSCQLDKASVLCILNSIPSYTSGSHSLTIGIHIDLQNDVDVLDAISNAEASGWTVERQWNGTPTSTASTFAMGSLIYAKVGEMELPDGTTKRMLCWGHEVTNWEENGYETFRSLESAYEYFGLEIPKEEIEI